MVAIVWLVLLGSAADYLASAIGMGEVIGQAHGSRQDLTSGKIFRDCSFSGTSDERGAAIFGNGANLKLFLVGCRFGSCSSAKTGGAICIDTGLVFSMTGTQGDHGSAVESGGFSYVGIDRDGGWFEVSECSVSASTAKGGGILRFEVTGTGTPKEVLVRLTNLTDNEALGQGSAIWFVGALNFIPIKQSIFARGSPANCLAFDGVGEGNLTSVHVLNNTCRSSGTWQGLIAVKDTTLNLMNCVFKANLVSDYWLGFRTTSKMAFIDCVFDDARLTRSGVGGMVVTVRCREAVGPDFPAVNAAPVVMIGDPEHTPTPTNDFTPAGPQDWTRGQLYNIHSLFIFLFHCELRPL